MGKDTNGVTMHAAGYTGGLQPRGRLYIEDARPASERDTDPDITQDYVASIPIAVRLTVLERLRLWAGRILVRLAWRLMP